MDIIRKDTAKQYRNVRRILKGGNLTPQNPPECHFNWLYAGLVAVLVVMTLVMLSGCAQASSVHISDKSAILSIIGEAENQGYDGMLAVACAIRNRGNLHGVYGKSSYRVKHHKYTNMTVATAETAWYNSRILRQREFIHGATGWGNSADLEKFRTMGWWKNAVVTAHIGNHYFYRLN